MGACARGSGYRGGMFSSSLFLGCPSLPIALPVTSRNHRGGLGLLTRIVEPIKFANRPPHQFCAKSFIAQITGNSDAFAARFLDERYDFGHDQDAGSFCRQVRARFGIVSETAAWDIALPGHSKHCDWSIQHNARLSPVNSIRTAQAFDSCEY